MSYDREYDHDAVQEALHEANAVCGGRLTKDGGNAILRLLFQSGIHSDMAIESINKARDEGKPTWPTILAHVKVHRHNMFETRRKQREEREESAIQVNEYLGDCKRDCQFCQHKHNCGHVRKAVLGALSNTTLGSPTDSSFFSREFPGYGFEDYGTPEYRKFWGDSCKVCQSVDVMFREDHLGNPLKIECGTCGAYLKGA